MKFLSPFGKVSIATFSARLARGRPLDVFHRLNPLVLNVERRVATAFPIEGKHSGRVSDVAVGVHPRLFHTTAVAGDSDSKPSAALSEAMARLESVAPANSSHVFMLKMYGLYKQATLGTNNTPRPSMMNMKAHAKWKAWADLGDMSPSEAEAEYIAVVNDLEAKSAPTEEPTSTGSPERTQGVSPPEVVTSLREGVLTVTLNRPGRFNAFSWRMYEEVTKLLQDAATNDDVRVVVFTGAGQFYSSGNDLANFAAAAEKGPEQLAADAATLLQTFVEAFIRFPKVLIGHVNGPAVGIAATTLGLFDTVYASHQAWFQTPFTSLAQSPEACSSLTFPTMMGPSKANEFLLFNRKFTAVEACNYGLVTEVFESADLKGAVQKRSQQVAALPPLSVVESKAIIRAPMLDTLLEVNRKECELLRRRWISAECMDALQRFATRKK